MSEPIIPFGSGLAWCAWEMCNCDECARGHVCINAEGKRVEEGEQWDHYLCSIEAELCDAYFGDGTITAAIAERMGPLAERCREFAEAGE